MKFSSSNKLIRWAYLFDGEWEIPDKTNVCALFWRVFVFSPLKCFTVAFLILVLWPIPLSHWLEKKGYTAFLHKPIRIPLPPVGDAVGLGWRRLTDWKSGICSIVEIDHK